MAGVSDPTNTASLPDPPMSILRLPKWTLITFVVLFAMNLLDYTDRWVLSAILPQAQAALDFDNTQAGLRGAFLIMGTISSLLLIISAAVIVVTQRRRKAVSG